MENSELKNLRLFDHNADEKPLRFLNSEISVLSIVQNRKL